MLLACAALFGEEFRIPLTPFVIGALVFQILAVASVSYLAWFWMMTRYPVSRLSAFSFLTPVFGVLCGTIYLDEPLSLALVAALGLVATGIYLVNTPPKSSG